MSLQVATGLASDFASAEELRSALAEVGYFAGADLATALFLALRLERPLLLEGEAGVGKTEVAKALARLGSPTGRPLIRLQCYEGLDLQSAVYEWDYRRQLLHIRLHESRLHGEKPPEGRDRTSHDPLEDQIYDRRFLLERPLLQALTPHPNGPPILLIDELDRADEEFEAYLLEILSDFQVTVPELGTLRAESRPTVIITSNRTRELHDALRRRCLYQWIDYPSQEKELAIVIAKVPEASDALARQVVRFVQDLRDVDLYKRPGVAETLDWVAGLVALGHERLDPDAVKATLGLLLKYQDDIEAFHGPEGGGVKRILDQIGAAD